MQERVLSGVQPTNNLHIGNYIGALKQWLDIQHRYQCLFCIVDLHAITVPQDPQKLRASILDIAATYLAIGIDPKRSHIFIQSEVKEHAELAWYLNTITKMGELERMTQFKDKAKKSEENVNLGLFSYPVLMAADILLYDTTVVPVGEDQVQHLELTRDLAQRFNQRFGETFVEPQALIQKQGARIMSLDSPMRKMSKSAESAASYIALSDDADTIRKKIMKAVTDTEGGIAYDLDKKPAVANLMTIYHHVTGKHMNEIEQEFIGKGYGDFKKALAEAVIAYFEPISNKIRTYREDQGELMRILDEGKEQAQALATKKITLVRERMGIGR